jgi:hypothetical protein
LLSPQALRSHYFSPPISAVAPSSRSTRPYPTASAGFLSYVEAHLNAIAAAILSESGMKWLMDVADKVSDEPKCKCASHFVVHLVPSIPAHIMQ